MLILRTCSWPCTELAKKVCPVGCVNSPPRPEAGSRNLGKIFGHLACGTHMDMAITNSSGLLVSQYSFALHFNSSLRAKREQTARRPQVRHRRPGGVLGGRRRQVQAVRRVRGAAEEETGAPSNGSKCKWEMRMSVSTCGIATRVNKSD